MGGGLRRRGSQLAEIDGAAARSPHEAILAFLENELGEEALRQGNRAEAIERFGAAIERDRPPRRRICTSATSTRSTGTLPRPSRRGKRWWRSCRTAPTWRSIGSRPPRNKIGTPQRFVDLCRRHCRAEHAGLARAARAGAPSVAAGDARRRRRTALRGAHPQPARAGDPPGDLEGVLDPGPAAATGRSLSRPHARTPSSTSTRTSACAAATAAPSCSGSARSATSGTRSSRNASRPRRTTSSSAPSGARLQARAAARASQLVT